MTQALRIFGQVGAVSGFIAAVATLFIGPVGAWGLAVAAAYALSGVFWWLVCSVLAGCLDEARDTRYLVEQMRHEMKMRLPKT